MKSRILSLAAVAGLLVAAGCSGGGAGSVANGITPVQPVSAPAKGTSSVHASFLVPMSDAQAASASTRKPQFLSPGTNGISVLMGNGTLVVGASGLSGTAQMTGSTNEDVAGGTLQQVSFLSASNSTTPVVGQTLKITHTSATTGAGIANAGQISAVFTITAVLSSTIVQGTFAPGATATPAIAAPIQFTAGDLITFVATGASTNGQQFIIGNQNTAAALTPTPVVNAPIPATVFPASAASTVSYSFAPSNVAGFFVFNMTISNLLPGQAMTLGVVTNDTNHNNFVLSEAQETFLTPTSGETGEVAAFTLNPVVAGVFVPQPTIISPLALGAAPNPVAVFGTYETTFFATDELGYIIPTINNNPAPGVDNAPAAGAMVTLAPTTAAQLVFRSYTAPGNRTSAPLTFAPVAGATTLTAAGTGATVTFGNTASDFPITPLAPGGPSITGNFFTDVQTSSPGNPVLNIASTNPAGIPVNITCGANVAAVAWSATIQSAAPASSVTGYVLTPGTNYPSNTAFKVALPAINCQPGIGAVIN